MKQPGKIVRLSPEERAARSARCKAMNADPAFRARQRAGAAAWSQTRRAEQAALMTRQNADLKFKEKRIAKPRPLAIPDHTHPVVRGLYVEINEQLATVLQVSSRSGVDYSTTLGWRRAMPRLDLIDAAGNALDIELAWVPRGTRDENGFPKKKKRQHNTGDET